MADIFISYSTKDRTRIIPIVKALEKLRWSTFWDWNSIPVGKTWRQFVKEGLDEARCVLVLWSEKSIDSEWVAEEAGYGKRNRILIPALIDDVDPPFGFGEIQAANLINWDSDMNDPEFIKLLEALESILGQAPRKSGLKIRPWKNRKVLEGPGPLPKLSEPTDNSLNQETFKKWLKPNGTFPKEIKDPTRHLLTPDRQKKLDEILKKK